MGTDPVFSKLKVDRGVSKIMVAVKDTSIPGWHLIRLEVYGFRTGIVISDFLRNEKADISQGSCSRK